MNTHCLSLLQNLEKALKVVEDQQADEEQFFIHLSKYPQGPPEPGQCPEEKCMPYNVLILGKDFIYCRAKAKYIL